METVKLCYKCKNEKLFEYFHKDKNRKDRYFPWCCACCHRIRTRLRQDAK